MYTLYCTRMGVGVGVTEHTWMQLLFLEQWGHENEAYQALLAQNLLQPDQLLQPQLL